VIKDTHIEILLFLFIDLTLHGRSALQLPTYEMGIFAKTDEHHSRRS